MIKKLDLQDIKTAINVLELQKSSYKIEAEMIHFYEIPPLLDTIESLKECNEIFYGYYMNEFLAGIISYKLLENILDIHRVAVQPCYFRMGIANKLIHFIEELHSNVNKIVVCTGKENEPAVRLYGKSGYRKVRDIEIAKNVYITEFEKMNVW